MTSVFRLVLACSLGLGCSSAGALGDAGYGACVLPANADTFDTATRQGCTPSPRFAVCGGASGGTVGGGTDSGVMATGGLSCSDACAATEFELTCSGIASEDSAVAAPASSLSCRSLTVPTPVNVSYYCCPCAK